MTFKAIKLDSGSGLSATFVPAAGMIGVSLVSDGREHLAQRHGLDHYVKSGSTMGLPILYPWANRLARDSWKFEGRAVRIDPDSFGIKRDENDLAIHGTLAASTFWQVDEAQASDGLESATLRATLDFGSHPELLDTFPFPHRLEIEFALSGSELTVRTKVTPTTDVAVPLAYGFHPYLTLPGSERGDWTVRLPEMVKLETDFRKVPTGITRAVEATESLLGNRDLDDAFSGVPEGAEFSVADAETSISLRFRSGYKAAQVYAPSAENFICFEAMKSPTNALVTGVDLASVEPGESDVSEFVIRTSPAGIRPEPDSSTPAATFPATTQRTSSATGPRSGREPAVERARSARFRLERDDPAGEVRRVAVGRVGSAVSNLRQSGSENRAEAVHMARKDMKKLRALLRLVRGELGKKTYRSENRRYRNAARRLSSARDAEVLAGTLDSLLDDYPADGPPVDRLLNDLRQRRRQASGMARDGQSTDELAAAADEIKAGGEAIADWSLEGSGFSLFESGLRRSYRDGRRALREIEERPGPEAMHEFRKRAKDLWYELRLLRNAWSAGLKAPVKELSRLCDLLGDFNDISVLLTEIDRRDVAGEDLSVLATVAAARQAELLGEAMPIARRIYAEQPDCFTARIKAYWSA